MLKVFWFKWNRKQQSVIQGEKELWERNISNQVLSVLVHEIPDVNWAIISEIEEAEVNEYTNELIMVIISIAILISIVAMVITFFYVRSSLAKPLKQMVSQVQELEITKTLDLRRRDEIGQIANAIDSFTNRLFEIVTKIEIELQTSVVRHKSWRKESRSCYQNEEQSSSLRKRLRQWKKWLQMFNKCWECKSPSLSNMREVVEERKSLLQTLLDQTISSIKWHR